MVLVGLVGGGVACSKSDDAKPTNDRGAVSFADPPEGSMALGLCYAYPLEDVKTLMGGGQYFKRLPPAAIGAEGDAVTGEACAFERKDPDGDGLSLRVEVRNYGEDAAALTTQFDDLKAGTLEAAAVEDIGDAAFSSTSKDTSLLQVRADGYLLTLASRADGTLKPIPVNTLKLLGASGLEQLP